MFNRKQNEIDVLNKRCADLAKMIKAKEEDLKIARHNNNVLIKENGKIKNENEDLRSENDDLKYTLRLINQLITGNEYNNNEVLKRRIIELSDTTGNQNR